MNASIEFPLAKIAPHTPTFTNHPPFSAPIVFYSITYLTRSLQKNLLSKVTEQSSEKEAVGCHGAPPTPGVGQRSKGDSKLTSSKVGTT